MPISPEFTSKFEQKHEINFLQCYPNGYLKYTDLCNLLQLTAGKHAELGGISFKDMMPFDQTWVLSRMLVEVTKLPKWNDTVVVKTWINSLENSRSIRCLEMYLNDEKIVGCETLWAILNTKTRRPDTLAVEHEHFEKFPIKATEKNVDRVNLNDVNTTIFEREVHLSDLDVVNHVNNVKYLEWCLNLINPKDVLNQNISSFEMNFLKELSLYDKAEIKRFENSFAITKEDKVCFALQLTLK